MGQNETSEIPLWLCLEDSSLQEILLLSFQNIFLYKQYNDAISYLNSWRIKNRKWVYKFGGNYMFVGCYEADSAFLFEEARYKNSEALKKLIAKKLATQLVNIPNYIKGGLYKNKPEYIQIFLDDNFFKKLNYAIANNLSFEKIKIKYPCIFYDDFHDIDKSKPTETKEFDFIYDGSKIIAQIKQNYAYQKGLKID